MAGFLSGFRRLQDTLPPYRYSPFLSNHDGTRVMTLLGNDISRAKLAATLLLTLPGLPFIYYGEEIGMTGDKPGRAAAHALRRADGRSGPQGLPNGRGQAVMVVANLGDSAVAGLSISSAPGLLPQGRYTLRNLLGGPAGSVFDAQLDGSLRGTLSPPSLAARESWVLELVQR
jgi:alpha amylase-like protein